MVENVWTVSDPDRWTFNYEIKDLLLINCIIIPACMCTVWCFRFFFRSIWNRISCLSLSIWWHVIRAIGHLSSFYESVIELFSVCKKKKLRTYDVNVWFYCNSQRDFSFFFHPYGAERKSICDWDWQRYHNRRWYNKAKQSCSGLATVNVNGVGVFLELSLWKYV